jgi:hypothetical protein
MTIKQRYHLSLPKNKMGLAILVLLTLSIIGIVLQRQAGAEENPWPTEAPAQVCGNNDILGAGPTTAPEGAVTVPAGNNESVNFRLANTTYWFAPGVHTLGEDIYGQIIPGDNASFIGAPGAVLDGQNINRFAFTQQASNVTVKYLEVRNFGPGAGNNDEGVINHDAGQGWTIENNYVHDNDGAGVFLGTDTVVKNNCLKNNGQYGFSSYHPDGVTNVRLESNEITGNNQDNWEALREGCGCTGGGKFWDTRGAVIKNNWVHGNKGTGLWADHNNAEFLFEGNLIENNEGIGIFYEVSYNFMIKNNALIGNGVVEGKQRADAGDPFPTGAIYISESGGDSRAGNQYTQSEIKDNLFQDNWDGVILWENSDRFCRPNEEFDTTNGCPFFDQTWGLRYKTQNVKVHNNQFKVDREAIECTNNYCGRNAVFSNYGTHPANSPYLGTVIQEAVTFNQGNEWSDNAYEGQWLFMPHDMDNHINFATWQAAPYGQDTGSTFSGDPGAPVTPPNNPNTPPVVHNHLDTDTSSVEESAGEWTGWYSANVSRSDETAHTGSHSLKVNVTDPWGWGVELANWPGFEANEGVKNLSFWGKLGSGTNVKPKMTVKWLDENQTLLQTDTVTLLALTTSWQKASVTIEAPAGTALVRAYLTDGAAVANDYFYLDDFVIGNAPNVIGADSADFESSLGEWADWYSATTAHDTTTAFKGNGSLRVDITDPWGWAIQTSNWPGFETTAGNKKVSFWAKQGTTGVTDVTLRIKWYGDNSQLQEDTVSIATLTDSWQKGQAQLTAPAGTTHAFVEAYGDSGTTGDKLYLDALSIVSLD